ncbi:putative carboxylesterase from carbohydrate esterase family ce10 [Moniliophthora roreri MCA 2997]|uniref:Carboxylic ester hydrolase n=2 Tax=Moniliophthora roreri TaxID=221103 RepID=V2YIM4_MONRO|nr:putative carboxylesterase from carbohydrate esterase family ce10 [Moniliophthora roreri MCA 2997]
MSRRVWSPLSIILGLALVAAGSKNPQGRTVSLLFENDADWEHFADRSSALLFHEPVSKNEAEEVCREHNESLFSFEKLDDVNSQLVYQQYLKSIAEEGEIWVSSAGSACSVSVSPPSVSFGEPMGQYPLFSQNITCIDGENSTSLPFLCTNSVPHTVKIDTDFTSSPKISVVSKETVFTGTRDHLSFRFMGIPYAEPPLGKLRLRYPQPWKGSTVDATALKPGCLQYGWFAANALESNDLNPWGNSEDCLYLNVYTPYIPSESPRSTQLKPVLVWFHGGGNFHGLGSDATFDGGPFASRSDVVIVTFNYRLNIFGFLSLNDGVTTGNYGFADKVAALQWVQDNISAFGGDPEKVTVFGQSAGGWSVIDLLKSPPAKGLFSRAISMSGGASTFATPEMAAYMNEPLVSPLCNGTGTERLECLQALPAEDLLSGCKGHLLVAFGARWKIYPQVSHHTSFMQDEFQSVLDAIFPNETDFEAALNKAGIVPNLAGEVIESGLWKITDEFTPYNATINVYSDAMFVCPAAELVNTAVKSSAFPALYVYMIRRAYGLSFFNPHGLCSFPVGKPEQPCYACHSGDLYEVFGTYHLFNQPVRVPEDIYFTALIQDMWASFARTGNPNPDKRYLEVRGRAYENTLRAFGGDDGWSWPEFKDGGLASLDYPGLRVEDKLPEQDNGRCHFLMRESKHSIKP